MDLKNEGRAIMHRNRRVEAGHQYTLPSIETYPHQWLWDSCFHAIILSHFEPEAAKEEIRSLFVRQLPDGMIPHMIFWKSSVWPPYTYFWGRKGTSSITQPPMVAYAVWEMHKKGPDEAFLREVYPKMFAFYKFMVMERDPADHHLAGIINPDESGEDNSPRFDEPMQVRTSIGFYEHILRRQKLVLRNKACNFDAEICMSQTFWVKDVPINVILLKNLEAFGHIASLLGEKEGEHFASVRGRLLKEAMRERLFRDGVFWSAMGHEYKPLLVATWAHFAPLFADLYTTEEAQAVIENHFYNDKTFHAPYGIRTTSKAEVSYRPDGFWRGPIWMAPHWFIHKGLVSYGFKKEANWLKEKSWHLLEKSGFREYFNPETGEGYGARGFTWGNLVFDMEDV